MNRKRRILALICLAEAFHLLDSVKDLFESEEEEGETENPPTPVKVVKEKRKKPKREVPTKKRRYWVHPDIQDREVTRRFKNFYEQIRTDEDEFFKYYQMSISSFDELLEIIRPHITKQDSYRRAPLSPEERLSITLRFLGTGRTYGNLHREYLVGKSTISKVSIETCEVIWECLKNVEMPEPTEDEWRKIAHSFYLTTGFPNCVGSIDGKHVRCIKPSGTNSVFSNYDKDYTIVLVAVADINQEFIMIDLREGGSEVDSTCFKESDLGRKLLSGTLGLPPPRCLPNTDFQPQPFVMVGDKAFRLHTNLLRPYPQRNPDTRQNNFNKRLSSCGSLADFAFRLLAKRWKVFHSPITLNPDNSYKVIKACCILHNFVQKRHPDFCDEADLCPFPEITDFGRCAQKQGVEVREFFADYFMGPGASPFEIVTKTEPEVVNV